MNYKIVLRKLLLLLVLFFPIESICYPPDTNLPIYCPGVVDCVQNSCKPFPIPNDNIWELIDMPLHLQVNKYRLQRVVINSNVALCIYVSTEDRTSTLALTTVHPLQALHNSNTGWSILPEGATCASNHYPPPAGFNQSCPMGALRRLQ